MVAGVAAGLADYFDVDPTLVRIGFVVLACLGGLAVPLYLAGWLLIPDEDTDQSVAEELLAVSGPAERGPVSPRPIREETDALSDGTPPIRQADDGWARGPDADLRASDAERNEVADKLSRHYADGRLDQIEFKARPTGRWGRQHEVTSTGCSTISPGW